MIPNYKDVRSLFGKIVREEAEDQVDVLCVKAMVDTKEAGNRINAKEEGGVTVV